MVTENRQHIAPASKPPYRTALVIGLILLLLYFIPGIIIPFIFSGIIAISLYPAHKWLTSKKFPSVLSALILVVAISLLFGAILTLFYFESKEIIAGLPVEKVPELVKGSAEEAEEIINNNESLKALTPMEKVEELFANVTSLIPDVIINIKDAIIFFISCPLYVFFMLVYSSNFKNAYDASTKKIRIPEREKILSEIQLSFRGYIVGMFWVACIISVLTSLGLWIIGMPYPIFLGVLTGFLSIIPYLGVLISAAIPCLIAILMLQDWWVFGGVIVVFVIVQTIEGNVITPKILGDKVNINPLAIIFGLLLFNALGGITAMIITVPLLALIQVIAKNNKDMKPVYELLKA